MEAWHLLFQVIVLLGAALLLGGAFARMGQSPLIGYLLGGVLAGPAGLRLIASPKNVEVIAELGVSLLLFSIGLEFSWKRVRGLGGNTLLSGVLQVGVTGGAAALAALPFVAGAAEATTIGAMVALSSTACVLRILVERGELDSPHGRNALAVLLVQDMAVVPLAVLMTLLGGGGTPAAVALEVGRILLLAAALLAGLYVALNKVAVFALGMLTLERNRELTVLLAAVTGLGASWAAHAIGLSPALGAFLAGMFLGGSPFAAQVRADIGSLRVVLLTLFFSSVGMLADPAIALRNWPVVAGATVLLIAGKTLIVWIILRALGRSHANGVATGLTLAQLGEFAFVLGGIALGNRALSEQAFQVIASSGIITLFLTPYLVGAAPRAGTRIGRWLRRGLPVAPGSEGAAPEGPDVLIIGFGPAGQAVGQTLAGGPETVAVIDLNTAWRQTADQLGFHFHVGDAAQADILEHAHVGSVKVVVIALPAPSTAREVLRNVRRLAPQAYVVMRSRHRIYKPEFEAAGAHAVVDEEGEVGYRLAVETRAVLRPEGNAGPGAEAPAG